jgi:hypothetical protein
MKRILFLSLSISCTPTHAVPIETPSTLPCDVLRFTEEREVCDHLRGEIPENPEVSSIEVDKYCNGTDKKLADLLTKYSNRPDIQETLSSYDPRIESNSR